MLALPLGDMRSGRRTATKFISQYGQSRVFRAQVATSIDYRPLQGFTILKLDKNELGERTILAVGDRSTQKCALNLGLGSADFATISDVY
ncbi:MAG: hypothetical protein KDB03_01640 [Planctomycetales bacterium]|nr:hypothetical protein [Planctomycetales bacterium]